MNGVYSKTIIKHFQNPKNYGRMKNPSGTGKVGNPVCGDVLWLYIKVKKDKKTGKEIITDSKFETLGCVVAIAVSSILTTMVIGKTIEQAEKITKKDILKKIGSVPPIKEHCSVLGAEALQKAIKNYQINQKLK